MTLALTIELEFEDELAMRAAIAQQDKNRVREILTNALDPVVESLFDFPKPKIADRNAALKRLVHAFTEFISPRTPPLSDWAVSRESMYEDDRQQKDNI